MPTWTTRSKSPFFVLKVFGGEGVNLLQKFKFKLKFKKIHLINFIIYFATYFFYFETFKGGLYNPPADIMGEWTVPLNNNMLRLRLWGVIYVSNGNVKKYFLISNGQWVRKVKISISIYLPHSKITHTGHSKLSGKLPIVKIHNHTCNKHKTLSNI